MYDVHLRLVLDASVYPEVRPAKVVKAVPEFADAFGFEEFNRMQHEALPVVLDTDYNVVASAPIASGKTALAELVICRTLRDEGTALFIAPLRALATEKETEWERFEDLDYSVYVITGERDLSPHRAARADILVMTSEKTDPVTRKHDSARYSFIEDVDCVVINKVRLLDSETRDGILEVTVSRMRRICNPRIVALFATMSNIDDMTVWLGASGGTTFEFGDNYRPVDLHAGVRTYTHGENSFADKCRRLYRAFDLAEPHIRDGGQSLVFVSSRRDTVRAAAKARDELAKRDVPIGAHGDYDFHNEAKELSNDSLAKGALNGVGSHRASLSRDDHEAVEEWFKEGKIQLLFSASTLAWGVDLPAHCVVIHDTKRHDPLEGEVDISPLDILQMLGRAGRPGYDDVGYGWVVCDRSDQNKYRRLLREGKEIESRLTEDLDSHSNTEIAMGTIRDLDDVMSWLETTFCYRRAQSNLVAYGLEDLRSRIRDVLDRLVSRGFIEMGDDLSIDATPLGRLTSKYYLRLGTALRFVDLVKRDHITADDVLETVAGAAGFRQVSAYQSEVDVVDSVLTGVLTTLEDGPRKVFAILHASMTNSTPSELRSDAWVIKQDALRLLSAFREFLDTFADARVANLTKCVEARVDNSVSSDAVALTTVDGIGPGRARKLATGGFSAPTDVVDTGVEELTRAGLSQGITEHVIKSAKDLPAPDIDRDEFPEPVARGESDMHDIRVRNDGGGGSVGVRVTVNDVGISTKTCYLSDEVTVSAGVFGAADDELEFVVEVAFPDPPLLPIRESRTAWVE